jgi:nitrate/TMAO reductase-like tetraheme cytochrome c subunit
MRTAVRFPDRLTVLVRSLDRRAVYVFGAGAAIAAVGGLAAFAGLEFSSSTPFCMSCHEMRVVGEQGWMHSTHYHNPKGVVADCHDCHIPPEPIPLLWTKTRDGIKDVVVHVFGESDPEKMHWDKLGRSARKKIHDSACMTCHSNLTPEGGSIKMILAHREYERMNGRKRCLDCHTREFHGRFKTLLGTNSDIGTQGETP